MSKKLLSKKRVRKINQLFSHPTVRYASGALASVVAASALKSLSKHYPEIANVLKEGMDMVEHRLEDMKENIREAS